MPIEKSLVDNIALNISKASPEELAKISDQIN